MTKTLTPELALELLEEAVKKRGADYVYRKTESGSCFYSNMDRSPSCGVGYVFDYFDQTLFDRIAETERRKGGSFSVSELLSEYSQLIPEDVVLTRETIGVLYEFQRLQDGGHSWGDSLEGARKLAIIVGLIKG